MHSLLENYLAEVAAHLGPLPAKRRAEELREMRSHLEAACAAGRERGQTEKEAARDVLAQFGPPDMVGAETITAWRRGLRLDRRNLWGAAACVLPLTLLMNCLLALVMVGVRHSEAGHTRAWAIIAYYVCPVIVDASVGGLTGALFPRRAVAGVGVAMVVFWVMGISLAGDVTLSLLALLYGLTSLLSAWAGSRWRTARTGRGRLARG